MRKEIIKRGRNNYKNINLFLKHEVILLAYNVKQRRDIPISGLSEEKEILTEWSSEISGSLEALRNERNKVARHISHLLKRIKFLEETFKNSKLKKDYLSNVNNLQLELSHLNIEIESKEKLLSHINA